MLNSGEFANLLSTFTALQEIKCMRLFVKVGIRVTWGDSFQVGFRGLPFKWPMLIKYPKNQRTSLDIHFWNEARSSALNTLSISETPEKEGISVTVILVWTCVSEDCRTKNIQLSSMWAKHCRKGGWRDQRLPSGSWDSPGPGSVSSPLVPCCSLYELSALFKLGQSASVIGKGQLPTPDFEPTKP